MASWTTPRTWAQGELVTPAMMNTHVRDNLTYLKDAPTFDGNVTVTGTLTQTGAATFTAAATFNGNVTVGNAAADTLTVTATIASNLIFTDATYDIGASGVTRPRDLFLSRNATIGGTLGVTGVATFDVQSVHSGGLTTPGAIVASGSGSVQIAAAGYLQHGANPATAGHLRFANGDQLTWRNAANNANVTVLELDSSNEILLGGGATTVKIAGGVGGNLGLYDTNQSHLLLLTVGSNLTANRIWTITTGDAALTTNFTATAAGTFLRSDGTNWAGSTLVLPNAATANRVVYATGANTWGESANLTFDGTALGVGPTSALGRVQVGSDTVTLAYSGDQTGGAGATLYGLYLAPSQHQTAASTNHVGEFIRINSTSASALTLSNQYGLLIAESRKDANTTVTNAYGLYVEAPTIAGTKNVGAYIGGNVGIGTTAPSTLLHVGLAGTTLGTLGLAGNTSGLVTIRPAAAAGTWTFQLPPDDGDAGEQLQTDGSGVTTWEAAASRREVKDLLGVLDPSVALARVTSVPIHRFRYRSDARGVGGDYTTEFAGIVADEAPWAMMHDGRIFSSISASGHAFAAIQALNQVQLSEFQQLHAQIDALTARVKTLEG